MKLGRPHRYALPGRDLSGCGKVQDGGDDRCGFGVGLGAVRTAVRYV